jgi:hypothetical protein
MKKTSILFVAIMLSITTCVHAQQIAGADVRSTSLRPDRSTDVTRDFISDPMETNWMGTKKKNSKTSILSIPFDTSNCAELLWSGDNYLSNMQWQQAFDTLTYVIEHCYNAQDASDAFWGLSTAVVGLYGPYGGSYRATFLTWLESVLYLNASDAWFCSDAEIIAGYLPLPHDTLPGSSSRATNISLAVLYWLIHNTTCDTPALS